MEAQVLAERVVETMYARDTFSQWLGITVDEVSPGRAVCRMTVRSEMLNGFSMSHGGIQFSLADSALAFACNTHGQITVSIDNAISYPHPVFEGDELTATAEELSATRRIAMYSVTVEKIGGPVVAHFRGTVYRTPKQHFPEEAA